MERSPEIGGDSLDQLSGQDDLRDLSPCCVKTIHAFAANNPMISCHTCKTMIKCFTNESAFRNFARFCKLRGRKISFAKVDGFWIIFFLSYQP